MLALVAKSSIELEGEMPTISSFTITNFKGAAQVNIDFDKRISTPVITLIGLNESGKTTILEALSYFVSGDNAVSSLFEGALPPAIDSLIPIHRKAAFTGDVKVSASVNLNDDDVAAVVKAGKLERFDVERSSFPKKVEVNQTYMFKDSVLTKHLHYWTLSFSAKQETARRFKVFSTSLPKTSEVPGVAKPVDIWNIVVNALKSRLPRMAYFPTFLVDLPKQVYLKEYKGEPAVNRYYRLVLQDVLDSLDENLSLQTHVCDRIDAFRAKDGSANWFSILFGGSGKAPIDAVFQKLSAAVTKEVLGSWENIFNRKIAAKSISLEWHIDTQKDNLPYATFSVSDGASKYAIDQRSLGFRWFFSFLLFTTFKQKAERSTIFLFDEPAANLHAKAQAELLKSFSRITTGVNRIVYSTHSHHMINPHWLSGAYIVENTAIDHDSDDAFGLTTKPTNVVATPYREFVAKNPTRTSYFQPVIEQLEYITPDVLGSPPFLLVEGITDYYAFRYIFNRWAAKSFSLMPGVGAGASGPQVSSMLGRGERFIILLDDDDAGKIAAKRYRDEWFLKDDDAITLADINSKFAGASLERLISPETKKAVANKLGKLHISKKEIGWYLAEVCADPNAPDLFDETTKENIEIVLRHVEEQFAKLKFGGNKIPPL